MLIYGYQVYKGEWRGVPVAVKKLKVQEDSSYPEGLIDELQREVDIMTTLRYSLLPSSLLFFLSFFFFTSLLHY